MLDTSDMVQRLQAHGVDVDAELDIDVLLAGGESWRWQLRDRLGRWIEMGAKVKWLANGMARTGIVTGSPEPAVAEVEESSTKRRLRIATNRLMVMANAIETKRAEARAKKAGLKSRPEGEGEGEGAKEKKTPKSVIGVEFNPPANADFAKKPINREETIDKETQRKVNQLQQLAVKGMGTMPEGLSEKQKIELALARERAQEGVYKITSRSTPEEAADHLDAALKGLDDVLKIQPTGPKRVAWMRYGTAVRELQKSLRNKPEDYAGAGIPKDQQDRANAGAKLWKAFRPPSGTDERSTFLRDAWKRIRGQRDENGYVRAGRPDGTGAIDDPIYVGSDLDAARKHLLDNKHIRMESRQDVQAIMTPEFAAEIKKRNPTLNMCLVGVQNANLFCAASKRDLIRIKMPQLGGKDVRTGKEKNVQPWAEEMLMDLGLVGPVEKADTNTLKPSQEELGTEQIIGMVNSAFKDWTLTRRIAEASARGDKAEADSLTAEQERRRGLGQGHPDAIFNIDVLTEPILVTDDGYVIDGHHRWAATLMLNEFINDNMPDVEPVPMNVRRVHMEIGEALVTINAFADSAGIARKKVKTDPGVPPPPEPPTPAIITESKVPTAAKEWMDKNMAKVVAELTAIIPEGADPDNEDDLERIWKFNKKIKKEQIKSRTEATMVSAADLEPGMLLYLREGDRTVLTRPIVASGVVAMVVQGDDGEITALHLSMDDSMLVWVD